LISFSKGSTKIVREPKLKKDAWLQVKPETGAGLVFNVSAGNLIWASTCCWKEEGRWAELPRFQGDRFCRVLIDEKWVGFMECEALENWKGPEKLLWPFYFYR